MKPSLTTAPSAYSLNGPSADITVDNATPGRAPHIAVENLSEQTGGGSKHPMQFGLFLPEVALGAVTIAG